MATIDRRGADLSQTDPAVATDPNPGLAIKAPVRVATTGSNIALAGLIIVDGVQTVAGDRVLVKDQTDARANGLYNAQSGIWQRTIDADNSSQFADGGVVVVTSGAANAGKFFELTTADPIVLGTSSLTYAVLAVATGLFVGDSGSGGIQGLVPAPPAGSAAAKKFLAAAGDFEVPPAFTGDSGTGGVQGMVPAPSAGQGAANAVLKASGAFGVVGLTNVRLAKTGAYLVANADNGSNIALGGNAFFTLTFNAASGYDANFFVLVTNEDSYAGVGTGRGKIIACNGLSSFILWPGQNAFIYNSNNVWRVEKQTRWKHTSNTGTVTLFVDPVNGLDTNDGLASGAGNALQTINFAVTRVIEDQFDLYSQVSPQIIVQLADGTHTSALHLPGANVGGAGNATVVIQGNAATPSNVVWAGAGIAPISLFDGAILEVKNCKIEDSAAPLLISVDTNAILRLEGGIILGQTAAGGTQIFCQHGGSVISDGGITVSDAPLTGNGTFINVGDRGYCTLQGQTVTFSKSMTYSQVVIVATMGVLVVGGTTWSIGAFTITGQRYNVSVGGLISTFGAGINAIPGTVAGAGTNPSVSPWGLYT